MRKRSNFDILKIMNSQIKHLLIFVIYGNFRARPCKKTGQKNQLQCTLLRITEIKKVRRADQRTCWDVRFGQSDYKKTVFEIWDMHFLDL